MKMLLIGFLVLGSFSTYAISEELKVLVSDYSIKSGDVVMEINPRERDTGYPIAYEGSHVDGICRNLGHAKAVTGQRPGGTGDLTVYVMVNTKKELAAVIYSSGKVANFINAKTISSIPCVMSY